jgi:hypothetical protein
MEYIYKVMDTTDGNTCFVIANSESEALQLVQKTTSLTVYIAEKRLISELTKPIIFFNKIIPF